MESPQNHLWLILEKCLNPEKALPCYFYHRGSTDPNGLIPMALDSYFIDLSTKICFTQFGSLVRAVYKFEIGYNKGFSNKSLNLNLN